MENNGGESLRTKTVCATKCLKEFISQTYLQMKLDRDFDRLGCGIACLLAEMPLEISYYGGLGMAERLTFGGNLG